MSLEAAEEKRMPKKRFWLAVSSYSRDVWRTTNLYIQPRKIKVLSLQIYKITNQPNNPKLKNPPIRRRRRRYQPRT